MTVEGRRGRGRLEIDLLVAVIALQQRLVLHTGRLLFVAAISLLLRFSPRARPVRRRRPVQSWKITELRLIR